MARIWDGTMKLNYLKYRNVLISVLFIIGIWIGLRYAFQMNASRTIFSGSIVLRSSPATKFYIMNPNDLQKRVAIDLSQTEGKDPWRICSLILENHNIYYLLAGDDETRWKIRPKIISLNKNGTYEIPIIWQNITQEMSPYALYVYEDKFYIVFQAIDYRMQNHIYSIPKDGGIAREVCVDFRLQSIGPASQLDSKPIKYKDGLICVSRDGTSVKFVNDDYETELFHMPVENANWFKGWYEEEKSLLIWSGDPNHAIIVDLNGNVIREHYKAWFGIGTSCWDVYGNAPGGILIGLNSTLDYFFFVGVDAWDFFRKERMHMYDYGIYDIKTQNIVPLRRCEDLRPMNWSSVDYDEDFLQGLAAAAAGSQ